MRITRNSGGVDFYESFSDLIFGTLIIFLVVVLALMVQVREASERLDKMMGGVVTPHRFAGGIGDSKFIFTLIPAEFGDGTSSVMVMFPWDAADEYHRGEDSDDGAPILEFCRLYLKGELLVLSSAEFIGMAGGLSSSMTEPDLNLCPAIHYGTLGTFMMRLRVLEKRMSQRFKSMSAEQVRDAIRDLDITAELSRYNTWIRGGRAVDDELLGPFNREAASLPRPAGIRFGLDGRTVEVGKTSLTVQQFRALLGTIAPGRGFVVEYVGSAKESNAAPPKWFEDEVLFPAGYDARVVRETLDTP